MPALAPTVVADDLTGACEIAALGFRRGLRSVVSLENASDRPAGAELWVVDAETRLLPPDRAATEIEAFENHRKPTANEVFFKKVDSVLRGNVAAEIAAHLKTRTARACLLAPVNPALKRFISSGIYTIDGIPLDQTDFARDPHHPAKSARVKELLAPPPELIVHSREAALAPDATGLLVPDTPTTEALLSLATAYHADRGLLFAGGAAFFDALLSHWCPQAAPASATNAPSGATLLLSGTLSARQHGRVMEQVAAEGDAVAMHPPFAPVTDSVEALLQTSGRALVCVDADPATADSHAIGIAFAKLAAELVSRSAIRHLIIEGGATAAAISARLGWESFTVVADWGGGTVSLTPAGADALWVTLKPGSYPWPPALDALLFSPIA